MRFVTSLTDNEVSDHSDDELVELDNREAVSEININPQGKNLPVYQDLKSYVSSEIWRLFYERVDKKLAENVNAENSKIKKVYKMKIARMLKSLSECEERKQILKKRLRKGEITKCEFDELMESIDKEEIGFRNIINAESKMINQSGSSTEMYYENVFQILERNKLILEKCDKYNKNDVLIEIQQHIEGSCIGFDAVSFYKSHKNISKLLIGPNMPTARDLLRENRHNLFTQDDINLISRFDTYTLEGLIIHTLGVLFNTAEPYSVVRVSTLIDYLNRIVREYGSDLRRIEEEEIMSNSESCKSDKEMVNTADSFKIDNKSMKVKKNKDGKKSDVKKSYGKKSDVKKEVKIDEVKVDDKKDVNKVERLKLSRKYSIGSQLVSFMCDRNVIEIDRFDNLSNKVIPAKKGDKIYMKRSLYALCKFHFNHLPIKMNLPMVCPPRPWECKNKSKEPLTLNDISGGYRMNYNESGGLFLRFRLLSSKDYQHFYIKFNKNYKRLIAVLNKLQDQPFRINTRFLNFMSWRGLVFSLIGV